MYAAAQYIEYSLVMKHYCRQHCYCNLIHRKWQERTCAQFDTRNAILFIPLKLLEVHANKISEFHFCLVTGLCALWQSAVCIVCWKCRLLKGLRYRVFILLYNYRLPLPVYRINITTQPNPHLHRGVVMANHSCQIKYLCDLHAGPDSIYFVYFLVYTQIRSAVARAVACRFGTS